MRLLAYTSLTPALKPVAREDSLRSKIDGYVLLYLEVDLWRQLKLMDQAALSVRSSYAPAVDVIFRLLPRQTVWLSRNDLNVNELPSGVRECLKDRMGAVLPKDFKLEVSKHRRSWLHLLDGDLAVEFEHETRITQRHCSRALPLRGSRTSISDETPMWSVEDAIKQNGGKFWQSLSNKYGSVGSDVALELGD